MAKSETSKMEAHFSVVLVEVPQDAKEAAAAAFAESFHLDAEASKQVVSTTPVVLFRDLAKPEVRAIKKKLIDLSKHGIEFRITPRPAESLPSIAWPTHSGFAETAAGEVVGKVTFEWKQHAFICPTCGEGFVIRPVGKAPITEKPAARAQAAPPAPEPKAAAPAREEKKAAPPPPKPAPAKAAAKKVEEIEEISEIAEPVEEVEEVAEPIEVDEVEEVEEIQEISDAEPIEEVEEIADVSGDIEMIDLEEGPKKAPPAAKKPAAKPPEKKAPAKAPKKEAEDEEGGDDGEEGDVQYSVFLSHIPRPDQQAQAAKMIAEVRGCPMSEAKDLAARMVIPVIKDVSKEDAEACLERFKKLKIQGRITKKK